MHYYGVYIYVILQKDKTEFFTFFYFLRLYFRGLWKIRLFVSISIIIHYLKKYIYILNNVQKLERY